MCRGPSFIVSTMQEETTPIFKRLWYDWTQQQPGIEPTNPLGQCWVPPIVAFYDQQGLLRTYSLPGSSIRNPHPGSPRGKMRGRFLVAIASKWSQVNHCRCTIASTVYVAIVIIASKTCSWYPYFSGQITKRAFTCNICQGLYCLKAV